MNTGDSLLRACLGNPDDDTPRLAYADWHQENGDSDRAEFIRLQLTIARHRYTEDIPAGVEARASELREAHEADWNPLPPHLRECVGFFRGLLEDGSVSTDEEAVAVAHCKEIRCLSIGRSLHLGGGTITDAGLTRLSALSYIEELRLEGIAVTANGMQALALLPRLRRMYLQDVTVAGPWFHHFRDTPRLVRVWAHSVDVGITPGEWEAWEQARAERFRQSAAADRQRDAMAFPFDDLVQEVDRGARSVRVIQQRVSDADVELLSAFPGLRELDLYQTKITNSALHHLSNLTELRTLGLGGNAINNLDGLAAMSQLRELNLIGMHVYHADGGSEWPLTDGGSAALSTLTGLESLCLSFNPITDVTLGRIAGLTNLRRLELVSVAGITDAGLHHLRGLKNLEHLDLRDTPVTPAGAAALLAHLPRVKIVGVPAL